MYYYIFLEVFYYLLLAYASYKSTIILKVYCVASEASEASTERTMGRGKTSGPNLARHYTYFVKNVPT